MTAFESQILSKLNMLTSEVSGLKKLLKKRETADEWLTSDQVEKMFSGMSRKSLQKLRTDGALDSKDWKSRNGRNFLYKKSALQNMFS